MKEQIKNIAETIFKTILAASAKNQGTFRLLLTAEVENESKPLLILGNAHSAVEDGNCIAILNPDKELLDQVIAGCTYGGTLKEIVSQKCDLMIDLWIDAYKTDGASVLSSYVSKNPGPSKFEIK